MASNNPQPASPSPLAVLARVLSPRRDWMNPGASSSSSEVVADADTIASSWLRRHEGAVAASASGEAGRKALERRAAALRVEREAFLARDTEHRVWLPHPTLSWTRGFVWADAGDDTKRVFVDAEERRVEVVDADAVHPFFVEDLGDYSDAVDLVNLHEGVVLDLLRRRAAEQNYYTFVGGDVLLIAVNPCAIVPDLYTEDRMAETRAVRRDLKSSFYQPHIFAIADAALCDLVENRKSQSIIISGDSGAGKTESCKLILRHLAHANKALARRDSAEQAACIEEKIIQANPVLEAFGNAKTNLNLNSSRFGKLIQIQYNDGGRIVGARVRQFLLEKSRLVCPGRGERSFHIFYQLCAGASAAEKRELAILPVSKYNYLKSSGCTKVAAIDDAEDFKITKATMERIGFSTEDITSILRLTSAVLRLGNVQFVEENDMAKVSTPDQVNVAAQLLGVDSKKLDWCLTRRHLRYPDGRTETVAYHKDDAEAQRDGLAKEIYRRIFECIGDRLNALLSKDSDRVTDDDDVDTVDIPDDVSEDDFVSLDGGDENFIGILDMSGFEIFNTNSLEQLLINYGNEKLQGQFHDRISMVEKDAYLLENIERVVHYDPFENLLRVQALEDKPVGIFPLLDNQCLLQKGGSDEKFLDAVLTEAAGRFNETDRGKVKVIEEPKFKDPVFIFHHYAGPVAYTVTGMTARNRDTLHRDLGTLLSSSTVHLLQYLFMDAEDEDLPSGESSRTGTPVQESRKSVPQRVLNSFVSRSLKAAARSPSLSSRGPSLSSKSLAHKRTVWAEFFPQLQELVDTLNQTTPRYVRCVKPNNELLPQDFHSSEVLHQLKCSGVLEYIKVRRQGLPVRQRYSSIADQYKVLVTSVDWTAHSDVDLCRLILEQEVVTGRSANPSTEEQAWDWAFGRTKVFLSDALHKWLDRRRLETHLSAVAAVQALWKSFNVRSEYRERRQKALVLQTACSGTFCHSMYEATRAGTALLQTAIRRWECQSHFMRLRLSVSPVQALAISSKCMKTYQCTVASARTLQGVAEWRVERAKHLALKRTVLDVQSLATAFACRQGTRVSLAEARLKSRMAHRISAVYKAQRSRDFYESQRIATVQIQRVSRGIYGAQLVEEMKVGVSRLQRLARGRSCLSMYGTHRRSSAAGILQALHRRKSEQKQYELTKCSILAIQSCARAHTSRKDLMAARYLSLNRFDKPVSIIVYGSDGVGKSSLINNILGREVFEVHHFDSFDDEDEAEVRVFKHHEGNLSIYDLDRPEKSWETAARLLSYPNEHVNTVFIFVEKISSFRLPRDTMRSITHEFGPSVWSRSVVVMTHGDDKVASTVRGKVDPSKAAPTDIFERKKKATNAAISAITADQCKSQGPFIESVPIFLVSNTETPRSNPKWVSVLGEILDSVRTMSESRRMALESSHERISAVYMKRCALQFMKSTLWSSHRLQSYFRGRSECLLMNSTRSSALVLQQAARNFVDRTTFLRKKQSVEVIGSVLRMFSIHSYARGITDNVEILQSLSRRLHSQTVLRMLLRSWPMRFQSTRKRHVVVVGPPGVGKSSLINLLYNEKKRPIVDAFSGEVSSGTEDPAVQVSSRLDELSMYDTQGFMDRDSAREIAEFLKDPTVHPVTSFIFVDRLDSHRLPRETLRAATDAFGPSMWSRCTFVLTHADNVKGQTEMDMESILSVKRNALFNALVDLSGSSLFGDKLEVGAPEAVAVLALNNASTRAENQTLDALGRLLDSFEDDNISLPYEFAFQSRISSTPLAAFRQTPNALKARFTRKSNWDILGIPRGAGAGEVKKAYRFLARKYHPDRNPEDVEAALIVFREIADAYEALSAPGGSLTVDLESPLASVPISTVSFPISVRTIHRRYWSVRNGKLLAVVKDHELGSTERFTVRWTSNGMFMIRAYNGMTVCLDDMGQLVLQDVETAFATRFENNPLPTNMFRIDFGSDGNMTLFAANDKYVVAERSGYMVAKSDRPRSWETLTWRLNPSPNGEELARNPVVLIMTGFNDKYVEMDPTTQAITCQCTTTVMAERVSLEQTDVNQYQLRCSNGRVLAMDEASGVVIAVDDDDEMEEFRTDFEGEFKDHGRAVFSLMDGKERKTVNVDGDGNLVLLNRRRRQAEFSLSFVFEDDQIVRKLEFAEPEILKWEKDFVSDVSTSEDVEHEMMGTDATPRPYRMNAFSRF